MKKAVYIKNDGSEHVLETYRNNDTLCISVPSIESWDIGAILVS